MNNPFVHCEDVSLPGPLFIRLTKKLNGHSWAGTIGRTERHRGPWEEEGKRCRESPTRDGGSRKAAWAVQGKGDKVTRQKVN